MSPLVRSLTELKERGLWPRKIEYWNAFAKRRIDFLGFADIYYADLKRKKAVLVQVFSAADDHAGRKHEAKMRESKDAADWMACGGEIRMMIWYPPTKTNRKWRLREVTL